MEGHNALVPAPFQFLSMDKFERLGSGEKPAYLSDVMEELERAKVPPEVRGWHSLFTQEQQQQQQPNDDTKPD
jgi:hypothetical protein